MNGTSELENRMGYRFQNRALLRQALTHPSMGKEDNQRLEFLGDAVLQYLMSDKLYHAYPKSREGELTHLRALLVCEAALSQVAAGLGVGQALIMDRGEELTGGREKPSVLCDAISVLARPRGGAAPHAGQQGRPAGAAAEERGRNAGIPDYRAQRPGPRSPVRGHRVSARNPAGGGQRTYKKTRGAGGCPACTGKVEKTFRFVIEILQKDENPVDKNDTVA